VWKFGKRDYIWLWGPQCHLICTCCYSELTRVFGGVLKITGVEPTDPGFVRVRLVVPSSCTVDSFYFLGRGRTDGRTRVFFRGGPTNAREKEGYPC
jgi:hypothetical protein